MMNAAAFGSVGLWPSLSYACRRRRRCCCQCGCCQSCLDTASANYSSSVDAAAALGRGPGPDWPSYPQYSIRIGTDMPAGTYSAAGFEWGANSGGLMIEIKPLLGPVYTMFTGTQVANQVIGPIPTRSYVDTEIIYVRLAYQELFQPGQLWHACTRADSISCFQPGLPFQQGRGFRGYDLGNGGPQVKFCKI